MTNAGTNSPPKPADPRCPRCGYDQRGIVATWTESCPLEGTCAECGLRINWGEVLSSKLIRPRWCVEYARSLWAVPWRILKTHIVMVWPWRFWSSLKMAHPIQWRRLVAHWLIILVVAYILFCLAQTGLALRVWSSNPWGGASTMTINLAPGDFIRVAAMPLSSESPSYTISWSGMIYPQQMPSPRDFVRTHWAPIIVGAQPFLLMHGLCALGFLALPVSRRIAKVRWSHIARITIYGLGIPIPGVLLAMVAALTADINISLVEIVRWLATILAGLWALLIIPYEYIWWSTATGRYLRMGHPWGVGAAVVVMAVLATMVLLLLITIWRYPYP